MLNSAEDARLERLERLSTAPGEARAHKIALTVVGDVNLQDGDDVIFSKVSELHTALQGGSGFRNVEIHIKKVEVMNEKGKWKNVTPDVDDDVLRFGNNDPEAEGGENAAADEDEEAEDIREDNTNPPGTVVGSDDDHTPAARSAARTAPAKSADDPLKVKRVEVELDQT